MAKRFILSEFAYAHRGLWSPEGPTENSLEACLLAAENGLGIEFDVRPSRDGTPIVFHDPTLERMTAHTDAVEDMNASELLGLSLTGGGEIISLSRLLEEWPATTPLLCELKIDRATDPIAFAVKVGALLVAYDGPVAAMSFSTRAVEALPADLRKGQLIAPSEMTGETDLASTPTTRVDYLACHVSDADNRSLQLARATHPLITWTVKSERACEALAALTDSQIFEGFDPKLAKQHILDT